MGSLGLAFALGLLRPALVGIVEAANLDTTPVVRIGAISPLPGLIFALVGPVRPACPSSLRLAIRKLFIFSSRRGPLRACQKQGSWCGELLVPELCVLHGVGIAGVPGRSCCEAEGGVGV